jgi:hypothetical protein
VPDLRDDFSKLGDEIKFAAKRVCRCSPRSEFKHMKKLERDEQFAQFAAAKEKPVLDAILKRRREEEGNSNWKPRWAEAVAIGSRVRRIFVRAVQRATLRPVRHWILVPFQLDEQELQALNGFADHQHVLPSTAMRMLIHLFATLNQNPVGQNNSDERRP